MHFLIKAADANTYSYLMCSGKSVEKKVKTDFASKTLSDPILLLIKKQVHLWRKKKFMWFA